MIKSGVVLTEWKEWLVIHCTLILAFFFSLKAEIIYLKKKEEKAVFQSKHKSDEESLRCLSKPESEPLPVFFMLASI